jgi:hypothetical protein
VLVRLGKAAKQLGRLPNQDANTAAVYGQLVEALDQMGRLGDIAH